MKDRHDDDRDERGKPAADETAAVADAPEEEPEVPRSGRRIPVRDRRDEDQGPPAEPELWPGEAETQALEERIASLEAELEQLRDQALRRQAELINYRRRVERERADQADQVRGELIQALLPVIDDFERAVQTDAADFATYREGVELILKSIQALLQKIGIERIDPVGDPFDPEHHEAMAREETAEVPDGHVLSVYQPGYRLGERLLRPAMVVVAATADGEPEDGTAPPGDEPGDDPASPDGRGSRRSGGTVAR